MLFCFKVRFLLLTLCISTWGSASAFKPPRLSDYQRKDLAKLGITKVLHTYEHKTNSGRCDTSCIRLYDHNGFLTSLDTFAGKYVGIGKVSKLYFLMSQKITYSSDQHLTFVRIEEKKKPDNVLFETVTIQSFDKTEKLIQEKVTIDGYTSIIDYKYDFAGNCIEKINRYGNMADTCSYTYGYDGNYNILTETRRGAMNDYADWYKYNSSGQLVEFNGLEKYEYDQSGKKIRHEFTCSSSHSSAIGGDGLISTYSYNSKGQLSQIKYREARCYPPNSPVFEYSENMEYLPSGLLQSTCSQAGCNRFIYIKRE